MLGFKRVAYNQVELVESEIENYQESIRKSTDTLILNMIQDTFQELGEYSEFTVKYSESKPTEAKWRIRYVNKTRGIVAYGSTLRDALLALQLNLMEGHGE